MRLLQDELRVLASQPNVRRSAVKFELPGDVLLKLASQPGTLLQHIPREKYFFSDKPERLLALHCLEISQIERVELPNGEFVRTEAPERTLRTVFKSGFKEKGWAFYTGYKWRSDPHCGVAVNIDYMHCRPNNARAPAGRQGALILFYPRIWLSRESSSYVTVNEDLRRLQVPGSHLYRLFEERYKLEPPGSRQERFAKETSDHVGLWAETTKQARIFRRYCDLIVLSDAVLLGDHWKTAHAG